MTGPRSAAAELVVHRLGGESVVWDPRAEQLHHLDATSTEVWELLDGRDLDAVVTELASRYGADPVVVGADVHALVADLLAKALVHPAQVHPAQTSG